MILLVLAVVQAAGLITFALVMRQRVRALEVKVERLGQLPLPGGYRAPARPLPLATEPEARSSLRQPLAGPKLCPDCRYAHDVQSQWGVCTAKQARFVGPQGERANLNPKYDCELFQPKPRHPS